MGGVTTSDLARRATALLLAGARPRDVRARLLAGDDLAEAEKAEVGSGWAVALGEEGYPVALAAIAAPPPVLFGRGDPAAMSLGVAVVGTRRATALAAATVPAIVAAVADLGVPVHSGLAVGVDARAHEAALAAGLRTTAVLATHPDAVTPRENGDLAERILAGGGALVGEQPPGVIERTAPRLLARNRITAGLSSVVAPGEMGVPSGTWTCVLDALGAGRSVVVPRPKGRWRGEPGAQGLLALAGETRLPRESITLTTRLAAWVDKGQPLANAVADSPDDLRWMIRLGHLLVDEALEARVPAGVATGTVVSETRSDDE